MKFLDLDGNEYSINIKKYSINTRPCSALEEKARELLQKLYPNDVILEQFPILTDKNTIFGDFLLISRNLLIEVDGQQHTKFNQFFHKNKLEFLKAKTRDKKKHEWAKINGYSIVRLSFDEDIETWENKILSRENDDSDSTN